jgi:uncharacterized protein (TIGR03083 family)
MASSPIWDMIHAERKALANDLAGLSDEQWNTKTLCDEWTVRQALAHMTGTATITPGKFFGGLIGAGFNFNKFLAKRIEQMEGDSPADTLANFEANVDSTKHPPGPTDSWLGETVIHAEDIRRPLGIHHTYDQGALERVAKFYCKSNLIIGGKKRAAGLKFHATDGNWSTGEGPEVNGPGIAIVMAITGRKAALADLSGEGTDALGERL